MRKIIALMNKSSGSVPADGAHALAQAMSDLGRTAEILTFESGDLASALSEAIALKPDCLIIWGGDGSVNCALRAAGPEGPSVLALPGGTMNMVHQRLHHGLTDWKAILASALSEPEIVPWAAGAIDGQSFYVAVMVGRLTTLSESRELIRKGALLEAIGAATKNEAFNMETRLKLSSRYGARTVTTPATAGAVVLAGERRPRFELAAIDPTSQLDLLNIGFQSLLNGWRDAEDVTVEIATSILLEDDHGEPIPATIDGEPYELPPVCEFKIIPKSARVVRARPSA